MGLGVPNARFCVGRPVQPMPHRQDADGHSDPSIRFAGTSLSYIFCAWKWAVPVDGASTASGLWLSLHRRAEPNACKGCEK